LPEQQKTQPTAELAEEPDAQGPEDKTSSQQTKAERASESSQVDLAAIREGQQKMLSQREKFLASIKYVEPQEPKTPLEQAKIEYRRALQGRDKNAILNARNTVLDLQRQEQVETDNKEMAMINQMKAEARATGNTDRFRNAQRASQRLYYRMKSQELKYLTEKEKVSEGLSLEPDLKRREDIKSLRGMVDNMRRTLGIEKQEGKDR